MLIAKVENGVVTQVADYRTMFPHTMGMNDEFLAERGCLKVNLWKAHDPATEQLVACEPYIEGEWVYTVEVQPLSDEQLEAREVAAKAGVKAQASALLAATDYLTLPDASQSVANLDAILTYRAALRAIAVDPPVVVESWPVKPDTEWVIG